jgi:hypothetical protein
MLNRESALWCVRRPKDVSVGFYNTLKRYGVGAAGRLEESSVPRTAVGVDNGVASEQLLGWMAHICLRRAVDGS